MNLRFFPILAGMSARLIPANIGKNVSSHHGMPAWLVFGAKVPPGTLPGRPWEPRGAPGSGYVIPAPPPEGGAPGETWAPKWHPEAPRMNAKRRRRGSWETVRVRGGFRERFFHVLGMVLALFCHVLFGVFSVSSALVFRVMCVTCFSLPPFTLFCLLFRLRGKRRLR